MSHRRGWAGQAAVMAVSSVTDETRDPGAVGAGGGSGLTDRSRAGGEVGVTDLGFTRKRWNARRSWPNSTATRNWPRTRAARPS